jgi:hypothetical protein
MACRALVKSNESIAEAMSNEAGVAQFWRDIQEPEALSLEMMYGLHNEIVDPFLGCDGEDMVVQKLSQVWSDLDAADVRDASVHGEEEKEIAHEAEREQQRQLPPPAKPVPHSLYPDVVYFATHGLFPQAASTFKEAFATMRDTSAGQFLDSDFSLSEVLVTEDFINVVEGSGDFSRDAHLRPPNWALSSTQIKEIVLVSPYEADQLISQLEKQSVVRLHVYSPKVTKTMVSFETLRFHTIPASLDESPLPETSLYGLGLFAGSLYIRDFPAYQRLCNLLGIATSIIDDPEHINVTVDRFVPRAGRLRLGWSVDCPFEKCPIPFFRALTALRMKGQEFVHSPIGGLFSGRILTKESFG